MTHTKDFGEKIVAKLADYIILFLNLFTLLLWMISIVHHKIGKKKDPLKTQLCNDSNNNNNNNNNKNLWCAIIKS